MRRPCSPHSAATRLGDTDDNTTTTSATVTPLPAAAAIAVRNASDNLLRRRGSFMTTARSTLSTFMDVLTVSAGTGTGRAVVVGARVASAGVAIAGVGEIIGVGAGRGYKTILQ